MPKTKSKVTLSQTKGTNSRLQLHLWWDIDDNATSQQLYKALAQFLKAILNEDEQHDFMQRLETAGDKLARTPGKRRAK